MTSVNEIEKSASFDHTEAKNWDLAETVTAKKRFIGGYKHKITNKVYHHAIVQTSPLPSKYEPVLKFHRDAQTVELQDQSQQTARDACTQVQARNIFISSTCDRSLEYSGSSYKFVDVVKKVIIMQKYARCWLARQELLRRKKFKIFQQICEEAKIKLREQQEIDWLNSLQERKLNPRTEEDFRLIFSDLQKWWEKEAKSIATIRSGADLKAAMWLLVNEEVKKIIEINKKKMFSMQKQEFEIREKSLDMAAQPKVWKGYNNIVHVETGNTHKARHLKELYNTLCMKYISSHDRIAALTSLKEVLQPYHCKLLENLIQLANREIDLLIRGTKTDRLEGLRNRIRDLFWQFVKQPVYNPQIQNQTKEEKGSKHILCCASCKRFYTLKPDATNDVLRRSVLANYFAKCDKCLYIESEAWMRKDLECYKKLLKFLIHEEENQYAVSGLLYIIQPSDIQYLVEKIWKRQSCISGYAKEDTLELIRYDFDKSWSPWNCLLVTRDEAQALRKIPQFEIKYDKKFEECVTQRHAEAKMYFSNIPRFFPYISSTCIT